MTTIDDIRSLLTVDNFRTWLETQPPDTSYVYIGRDCVVGQFVQAHCETPEPWGVGGDYVRLHGHLVELPLAMQQAALAKPRTFGAVLAKLDELTPKGATP